jgi:hypothetical protein
VSAQSRTAVVAFATILALGDRAQLEAQLAAYGKGYAVAIFKSLGGGASGGW